ncbi:MAG: PSP1 C-terminal domain-containing protein [Planctomycetaceae bacterium]
MPADLLVRYGVSPDVGRFPCPLDATPGRGERVVLLTHRGEQVGVVLQHLPARTSEPAPAGVEPVDVNSADDSPPGSTGPTVLRIATADDLRHEDQLRSEAQALFPRWQQLFADWNLQLELLDLEWTFAREKLVIYVLGGRGPDTTRLALLAAAAGQGPIEVQPVTADGLVPLERSGGGCGSGGCGCSH